MILLRLLGFSVAALHSLGHDAAPPVHVCEGQPLRQVYAAATRLGLRRMAPPPDGRMHPKGAPRVRLALGNVHALRETGARKNDVNMLVAASRSDHPYHRVARAWRRVGNARLKWAKLRQLCLDKQFHGNELPDAWLAAAVDQMGERLVSFDRDFRKLLSRARFTHLRARSHRLRSRREPSSGIAADPRIPVQVRRSGRRGVRARVPGRVRARLRRDEPCLRELLPAAAP